jgi:uncharacterized membrane protein
VISIKPILQVLFVATVGTIYISLCYFSAISDHHPIFAVLLGILPIAVACFAAAWHFRSRNLSLLFVASCALIILLNFEYLQAHVAWLYFIQHVGAMSVLGVTFGRTLGQTHGDALCSSMARVMNHKPLDEGYLRYTWNVTLAWTIFFAISALVSVLLFFFGPIEIWSFFANVLTPILVVVMFAGEYLIRLRVLTDRPHFSISETIFAYREFSRRQNVR